MKKIKKQLATITILIKDRQMHAAEVQKILTDNGHIIISRLGVNVQKACIDHCTGLIVVVAEAAAVDIKALTKKLNKLYGISAKDCIITK